MKVEDKIIKCAEELEDNNPKEAAMLYTIAGFIKIGATDFLFGKMATINAAGRRICDQMVKKDEP
jgi:hypothetical protein